MTCGKNTHEYQTLKRSFSKLSAALAMKGVIDSVSGHLMDEGLISGDQRDVVSNDMIGAKKRASDLASLLLNKVEQDTKNFQKIIGVLQQDPDTFETFLKHVGVADVGSSSGHHDTSSSGKAQGDTETVKKQPAVATKDAETNKKPLPGSFSDNFSPQELCDWLAAIFKEKGLELKKEQRDIFIKEEINGLAFKTLNDDELKEMHFRIGPRKIIMKIILSLNRKPILLRSNINIINNELPQEHAMGIV